MEEIFLETIGEHQRIIHKISRMYRNSREDQQDLFQEIVYQLWRAFPAFRHEAKVTTWIYRIALNTAMASYRKRQPAIALTEHPPDLPDAETPVTDREEWLFRALRTLSESERALVSLYLEDYSYTEIASITGISENYVGVKLHRIKEKLKTLTTKIL
ncbi:DNA-directed RNA polymerase sigma-70 factor [Dyadobacter beijingensis]|uniref:DNA-directed RNA polymerase sigma-70 factor n=1 Tax=Dyadobacter beijingensis TaxID=365489 RepID=A0ABQ2HY00_9BACT|nr:sigma-70 family RNA polymerase sigma factor [Dyadobacter beijingensis]GGM92641.1 DNA-directed RNA polymerase sigma-70 factor [Dyadobacter beijingensis]